MTVDFSFKKAPAYRVAFLPPVTEYKESNVRTQFERIARWAHDHEYRTGKWFFLYLRRPSDDRFQVAIEIQWRTRGDDTIHTRQLPATRVGSVTFDPDMIAPRVVFFGITDWLRRERKEKAIRSIGSYREVYDGNPWTDRTAWSRTTLQVLVR